MGARTTRMAMLAQARKPLWYETDALFAWKPQSSDTGATITPTMGTALTQTSAAAATGYVGNNEYDMTGGVYTGATSMTASLLTTTPFGIVVVCDKNTQSATFQVAFEIGASSNIQFDTGNGAPRFKLQLNVGAYSPGAAACIAAWPAAGTLAAYWVFCDPAANVAGAGTVYYGNGQNTFTTQSAQSVPNTGGPSRNVTLGAGFSSTTNVDLLKHGVAEVVGNRTGASALTLTSWKAIVQKIQNLYGI